MTIRDDGDDVFDTALSLKDRHGRRTSSRCRLLPVERDPPSVVTPTAIIVDAVLIQQSAGVDIQLQRQSIRLDVKLQLFDKLCCCTFPNRIIRIDEIANRFKHRLRRIDVIYILTYLLV